MNTKKKKMSPLLSLGYLNNNIKNDKLGHVNDSIKVENPFTKYGVLPSKLKKSKRKIHSAPTFLDFNDNNNNSIANTSTTCIDDEDDIIIDDNDLRCHLPPSSINFNSVDVMMERLHKATKNPFFDSTHTRGALRQYWSDNHNAPVNEHFIRLSINEFHYNNLSKNLFYHLEHIVDTHHGQHINNNQILLPDNNDDYDTIEYTPIKYERISEYDELILDASTNSACKLMNKIGKSNKYVKPYDLNDDFMLADAEDYAMLQTRFGRIIYSPKIQDNKYMYRFVILTKEAQEAVDVLCKNMPKHYNKYNKRLLTEYEIIKDLGIQMSSGWEHFFYFKNTHRELILRKPL